MIDAIKMELITLPKTDNYIYNSRGTRLHLRKYLPKENIKAIVLYLHGCGSHGNRPAFKYMADFFVQQNIAVFALDFTCHGYSYRDKYGISMYSLINDCTHAVTAIFSTYNKNENIPFFILGHSMGGSIAILMADIINDYVNKPSLFRGLLLISPMVRLKINTYLIRSLAYLFPNISVPVPIYNNMNTKIWDNPEYINYIENDPITRSDKITFKFTATLLDLSILAEHTPIRVPFIVLYDVDDFIISSEGIDQIVDISTSSSKTKIKIPGGLHDPLANKPKYVSS